jgi:hypothetical protein
VGDADRLPGDADFPVGDAWRRTPEAGADFFFEGEGEGAWRGGRREGEGAEGVDGGAREGVVVVVAEGGLCLFEGDLPSLLMLDTVLAAAIRMDLRFLSV